MESNSYSKLIGCNIHGSIRVSPMALKIINTPEFQRMRSIKQLGLCHHIYPAATHTRFEHSIGVYHLAGKFLEKIQQQYPKKTYNIPELGGRKRLTNIIAECIKIAALCHDIGHGPFSHIFDDILLKYSTHPNREHETRSCLITEILCKRELASELSNEHIEFIKSIINPQHYHMGVLYQIVSNHLNGIDVDKFDYLERDAKNLGLKANFDSNRLINEFIIDSNNNIAYPKHCSVDIFEMFHSRYMMHKKVYNHKTVKLVESMLADLFIKIDPIFKISESINNMDTFCKLTDDTIFHYIQLIMAPPPFIKINLDNKQFDHIKKASQIYQNIISRNLYQQISEMNGDEEEYLQDFIKYLLENYDNMDSEDFEVIKTTIGFVSGNKPDPFTTIYFYDKKENNKSFVLDKSYISGLINNNIQETKTHLVCKKRSIQQLVSEEFNNYGINRKKRKVD